MKKKYGFTLAEIIISMGIVGVIATLTIPNTIHSTSERESYAKTSTIYSSLAQATKIIEAKQGRPTLWDIDTIVEKEYLNILNTTKCRGSSCFDNDGDRLDWSNKFITLDGTFWNYTKYSSCNGADDDGAFTSACLKFEADINGGKGPNKIGKDIFGFIVSGEGTFPIGGCPGCSSATCTANNTNKYSCTAILLHNGKLPKLNK